jgi:hypothetical protein
MCALDCFLTPSSPPIFSTELSSTSPFHPSTPHLIATLFLAACIGVDVRVLVSGALSARSEASGRHVFAAGGLGGESQYVIVQKSEMIC